MIYNDTLNNYKKVCNSCTIYVVLFIIFLIISISISLIFIGTQKKDTLKQQFIKNINGKYQRDNIKTRAYYFINDMINID